MKNLLTKSLALVFGLGVAATFTACHNGEDAQPTVMPNVIINDARTLVINANKAATFTFGTETQTGTQAIFYVSSTKGIVTVTAEGRNKKVNFDFADGSYLEYDVEFESAGKEVNQSAAESGAETVDNSGANESETGVKAEMVFDNNQTNTGTTGNYSVTVVTPTETETSAEQIDSKEGKENAIQEPVLSLDCKPDGANFGDNPVKVKVSVPYSGNYELDCTNSETDLAATSFVQSGDTMTIELSHFSIWDIIMKATVVKIDPKTENYTITGDARSGHLRYKMNYGYDCGNTDPIVSKYLKKVFGVAKRELNKTVTFKAVDGTANLNVSQQVKVYTIKSGKTTFKATVYGKVTQNLSIETTTPEEVKTHDGGSTRK